VVGVVVDVAGAAAAAVDGALDDAVEPDTSGG
jgi:hypothetical protein